MEVAEGFLNMGSGYGAVYIPWWYGAAYNVHSVGISTCTCMCTSTCTVQYCIYMYSVVMDYNISIAFFFFKEITFV